MFEALVLYIWYTSPFARLSCHRYHLQSLCVHFRLEGEALLSPNSKNLPPHTWDQIFILADTILFDDWLEAPPLGCQSLFGGTTMFVLLQYCHSSKCTPPEVNVPEKYQYSIDYTLQFKILHLTMTLICVGV